jgi:hypothetical protein
VGKGGKSSLEPNRYLTMADFGAKHSIMVTVSSRPRSMAPVREASRLRASRLSWASMRRETATKALACVKMIWAAEALP